MNIKNWNLILYALFLFVLSFTACTEEEKSKIVGVWERYDDRAAGTLVKVSQVNGHFEGKIIKASGELAEDGFLIEDVKWRNIAQETNTYYTGEDLSKGIDKFGKVQSMTYDEVYFEVIAEDILRITHYANGSDEFGKKQKWKRIRNIQNSSIADSLPK